MWKRCWWATWVSGFFGITGVLHVARLIIDVPLRIGAYDVPRPVTVMVGIACLIVSAGLLWVEWMNERAKRHTRGTPP